MFENLSKRERILAISLAGLMPLALIFVAAFWFIQKYGDNDMEIGRLVTQVADEDGKTLLARKAMKRLDYYQHISLARNLSQSTADYQLWVLDLARRHQLIGYEVKPQQGQTLKFKNKEIGRTQVLKFEAEGGLEMATAFLNELYALNTLHRIKSIRLSPKSQMVNGKRVRTGTMAINLDIELAVLNNGNTNFDFAKSSIATSKPLEEYQKAIVNRNIFGPPNNTPIVSVRPSSSYATDSEVRITVKGEDGDKDDQLQFDLLSAGIDGAKIEPREGTRDATLILPPAAEGTYKFKVGVKDNGFPAKESEAEFQVVLKTPPNKKPSVQANLSNPYPPDRPIRVILEGSDGDSKDILEFAIVSGIEGAEIVKQNESDRNPVLNIPPQSVGTYPFVVSVRDGREGPDDKIVEKTFEVQVVRRFSHLNETRITGIVREKTGAWLVNVRIRTTGQRFGLTEGESFEVEGQTFTVDKIEPRQVTFRCGEQRLVMEPGKPFGSLISPDPISQKETEASATETVKKEPKS